MGSKKRQHFMLITKTTFLRQKKTSQKRGSNAKPRNLLHIASYHLLYIEFIVKLYFLTYIGVKLSFFTNVKCIHVRKK
jgi:hypothetical protein